MNKKYFAFFAVFLIFSSIFEISAGEEKLKIGIFNDFSLIPAFYLFDEEAEKSESNFEFSRYDNLESFIYDFFKGQVDVGFIPCGIALETYSKAEKSLVCLGISQKNTISLVTQKDTVHSFSDLKRKNICLASKGSDSDFFFKYLLTLNEIEFEKSQNRETSLSYFDSNSTLLLNLFSDKSYYVILPEPYASIALLKSPDVKKLLDFQSEYQSFTSDDNFFPMTFMVANKNIIGEKGKLIDVFILKYEQTVKNVYKNPVKTSKLCLKYKINIDQDAVQKALPNSGFVFIPALNGRKQIESFAQITQRKAPGDDFYY